MQDQQIVLHSSAAQPEAARELVVRPCADVGIPQAERMESLRANREAHRHKQIWIKDPHGGPYRKAKAGNGYDPMTQNPDGTEKKLELGFVHAVEVGPTSNFVGNHMTQGAIDLVQAELGQRPSMAKRMQQAQNTVIRAPQPKLLEPVPGPPPRLLMDGTEAGDCMAVTVQAEEELGIGPVVVVPGQRPPDLTELRKAVRRQRRP